MVTLQPPVGVTGIGWLAVAGNKAGVVYFAGRSVVEREQDAGHRRSRRHAKPGALEAMRAAAIGNGFSPHGSYCGVPALTYSALRCVS